MNSEQLEKKLDIDDVGQKRYVMNQLLDELIKQAYDRKDEEVPDDEKKISKLEDVDGYAYKLSQEFLMSSSTLEKERKLEKLVEHLS
ncbi:MAG: hypothetical protein H8Z69_04645 [Nanohaloarchaea archaeon]|nr:hypothetical protein [Candidatus Nanohaloarchaea archaeon]